MPLPLLLPLAISAASALPGIITGIGQNKKAGKINPVRPYYEIPEAERRPLTLAENMASQGRLPGQSAIEGRLDQNTANQVSTIERLGYGGAEGINAASRVYGNQQDAITEVGIKAAENRQQNQRLLGSELNNYAKYEDKQFQINKQNPYDQDVAAKAALKEAALKNITGGLQQGLQGASNIALNSSLNKMQGDNIDKILAGLDGGDKSGEKMALISELLKGTGVNPANPGTEAGFTGASPFLSNEMKWKSIFSQPI